MTIRPLSLREKVFIAKYEELGGGRGAGTPAAIAAGYKETAAAVMAYRLLRREHVQREIQKRQRARLRALHSKAIDAIEETLDDKSDPPTRLRAANQVLTRVDPAVATTAHQTTIDVTVKQVSGDELGLKILRLAREVGWSREMTQCALGPNTDLRLLERQLDGRASALESEPVVIEGEIAESVIADEALEDDTDGD
jgi:hypothetical protein